MSKRYVLIEEYPNSPKRGLEIFKNGAYWQSNFCTKNVEHFHSKGTNFDPKDFPKNWKLVEEFAYEILTMGMPNLVHTIAHKQKDGLWSCTEANDLEVGHETTERMFELGYIILSVKRLSDGAIFSVGDKLDERSFVKPSRHRLKLGEEYDNIITKIGVPIDYSREVVSAFSSNVPEGTLFFCASNKFGNYNVPLEDAILAKEALFTTEDGVKIYKGDIYFYINTMGELAWNKAEVINHEPYGFSTRVAALCARKIEVTTTDGIGMYVGDIIFVLQTIFDVYDKSVLEIKVTQNMHEDIYNGVTKIFSTFEAAKRFLDRPLFRTEDDIAIYEGNKYWCVNTAPHLWSLFEQTAKERTMLNKTVRAFSTLEKATMYRLMNQPNISINDIRNAIETEGLLDENTLLKIVESRQSKLNE